MSRTKDTVVPGLPMVRVTERDPCPVCGRRKFCRVRSDGAVVWCDRVSDGASSSIDYDLGRLYVHHLHGASVRPRATSARASTSTARAPADVRDRAYRAVLGALGLDPEDRAALLARGLSVEAIATNGYATLPERERARLARVVLDAVGETYAPTIPGVVWREGEAGRGWWTFGGAPGLLVPVRDLEGRIVALKVRRRDPGLGARYMYVTSSYAGGPAAENALHVPVCASTVPRSPRIVVTEGELKADVAAHLGGFPVVSVPGVAAWRLAVTLAHAWGAREVIEAFDADKATNPAVATAARDLLRALLTDRFDARSWTWDARHKGLDDALWARGWRGVQ